jgi:hypothetical protein
MLIVAALGVSTAAFADGKLPKGTEHSPPVFVDESNTYARVTKTYPGWSARVEAVVGGVAENDHFRLVVRQGGKVISDTKCGVNGVFANPQRAAVVCEDRNKPLTQTGPVDYELVYKDDKTDKEFLVRTYKVTVKNWRNYPANAKEKLWDAWAEDLPGMAFLNMDGDQHVYMSFWVNSEQSAAGTTTLRCSIDGKALEHQPIEADWESHTIGQDIDQDARNAKGDTITYRQHHIRLNMRSLGWGSKEDIKKSGEVAGTANYKEPVLFVEHPGAWLCQLRRDQETLREFAWTVNADGKAEQDEMNKGKGAIPTLDNVVMIEMHIPKDDKLDEVIQADKWKASFNWGLPWPDHAKVKKIHATFPTGAGKLAVPQ